MSSHPKVWPWYAGAGALTALDQITKILVRLRFELHESLPIFGGDFFRLTYVLNPGIAFGLRLPWPTILLIFGWIAAAILAAYLSVLVRRRDILRWPVMLFLAGAIGNSLDRALYGQVTDFLDVDFPDFIMDRWPVFNVADSCVTIGILWVIALLLFHRRHTMISLHSHSTHQSSSDTIGGLSGKSPLPPDDRSGPAASTD